MTNQQRNIAIRGAGVVGLWQALTLARRGHKVTLCERSPVPFAHGCSLYAGAMLAPNCEKESAELIVRDLGRRGLALWRETYPGAVANGTLVVALQRDRAELDRFARMTKAISACRRQSSPQPSPRSSIVSPADSTTPTKDISSPEPALHFLLEQAQAAGASKSVSARANVPPMPISSSTAAVLPPRATCQICAACAASGSW